MHLRFSKFPFVSHFMLYGLNNNVTCNSASQKVLYIIKSPVYMYSISLWRRRRRRKKRRRSPVYDQKSSIHIFNKSLFLKVTVVKFL